jgi:hypothetical protein
MNRFVAIKRNEISAKSFAIIIIIVAVVVVVVVAAVVVVYAVAIV